MCKQLIEFFERDRFAAYNGIKLVQVKPGFAVTEMTVTAEHLNGLGIVQGGAIFTLADFAFAAASNAAGQTTVGINAHVAYFKASKGGKLTAEAKEVSGAKKITGYNVEVFNEHKELIAHLSFTGYKKKDKREFA